MKTFLMRIVLFTSLLLIGAVLTACGSTPATGEQAAASELSPAIAAASASPAATTAATAEPTATIAPTATVAPTHTPMPTAEASTQAHDHMQMPEATATTTEMPVGAEVQAEIKLFQYNPEPLEVAVGTTVVWTNQDDIEHSVTHGTPEAPGDTFDSGLFPKGQMFSFTFTKPGEYLYFCSRHNSMQGRVNVTEVSSAAPSDAASAHTASAPPERLVIPQINLDVKPVAVGLDQQRIPEVPRHDVGWFTGSAQPGRGSNVIFWGHVLRWKDTPATPAPFERLHELRPGAEITVFSNGGPQHYQVTEQIRVRPENVAYLLPTAEEQLTFVSCIGDNVIVTGTLTKEFRLVTIAKPVTS
ncbi:MAG: sortase [Chloroflexota bacterium]|nr:sortase [Chloroflexota bacterium]PLS80076.1 MAG: hypothetical protein CYG59_09910 [Chloroflexota bacterium]